MSRTILTVEDEPIIREMIGLVLSGAGYVVAPAGTGRDALDMLARNRFDLVLLDVHMPRMSGLDVLERMQRMGRTMPPVLMLTADREISTVTAARDRGCVGYVVKPFTPETLLERVRHALARPASAA
ncbi:MAG: response regulator transcription factor [Brevundimonas sp.]|uniref:response regulator transcription factor n=1 Tax=Brevundimonas sp. TaxID=1871086 RepID=UPI00391B1A75